MARINEENFVCIDEDLKLSAEVISNSIGFNTSITLNTNKNKKTMGGVNHTARLSAVLTGTRATKTIRGICCYNVKGFFTHSVYGVSMSFPEDVNPGLCAIMRKINIADNKGVENVGLPPVRPVITEGGVTKEGKQYGPSCFITLFSGGKNGKCITPIYSVENSEKEPLLFEQTYENPYELVTISQYFDEADIRLTGKLNGPNREWLNEVYGDEIPKEPKEIKMVNLANLSTCNKILTYENADWLNQNFNITDITFKFGSIFASDKTKDYVNHTPIPIEIYCQKIKKAAVGRGMLDKKKNVEMTVTEELQIDEVEDVRELDASDFS